ncbi:S-layer homology domain-containing protein [Indiicoccus explosivorum]|uniref:S-layer homology domain-containing protein n=1 Tax=Indiicoccus explosivorum TaxID=1917864 RepID=UPI000B44CE58|nr:S-layer homology domain-containing protein [Indiicoccus explosivorum]
MKKRSRSLTKITAAGVGAVLAVAAVSPAVSADTVSAAAFTDVPDRYEEAVEFLVASNLASGLTETRFGIDEEIKRGDAAVILAKALGIQDPDAASSGFADVPDRAVLAINSLKQAGVVNGKTAVHFGFEDPLKRGEAALMLADAGAYSLDGEPENFGFSDVSDRYRQAVAGLLEAGITQGETPTEFGTDEFITRGEFALFIYRAETLKSDAEGLAAAVEAAEEALSGLDSMEIREARVLVEAYADGAQKEQLLHALAVQAALVVVHTAEAENTLEAALAALADISEAFSLESVHPDEYSLYLEMVAGQGFITAGEVQEAVAAANRIAEKRAVAGLDAVGAETTEGELLELLEVLHNRSLYASGEFGMEIVDEALLGAYLEAFREADVAAVSDVTAVIAEVNERNRVT